MDDDLQTLEAELSRLRPTAPHARIAGRIDAALAASPGPARATPWWWGIALPSAAAVAVLMAVTWRSTSRPGSGVPAPQAARVAANSDSGAVFKPVAVENVLYAAQDEGIVTLADGTPARRQRLQYVDTITWRNSRTNASLTWTVPREEVRVVPVSFQ